MRHVVSVFLVLLIHEILYLQHLARRYYVGKLTCFGVYTTLHVSGNATNIYFVAVED
jgi:hypothetical protein